MVKRQTRSQSKIVAVTQPLPKRRRRNPANEQSCTETSDDVATSANMILGDVSTNVMVLVDKLPLDSLRQMTSSSGHCATSSPPAVRFDQISDNVIVYIFSLLTPELRICIERVCRRWQRLARLSWSSFKTMTYASFGIEFPTLPLLPYASYAHLSGVKKRVTLNNDVLKSILQRGGRYLKFLDLSGYRDTLDYRILPVVGRCCPNLETINLTGILVTNSSLRSLALRCTKLRSVIFRRCFQDSIIDRGLSHLLSGCPQLDTLNLSENERMTGRCFHELPSSLKIIVLSMCYELQDEGVCALADRCPNLEILHLDSCDHVTAKALEYAFEKLSRLRVLHLGEYYGHPVGVQMSTLCKLSHLKELYLNDNYLIDDTTLEGIGRCCLNLEKLDISSGNKSITDHGLAHLCRLKLLCKLNLSYLCRITDVGLKTLARLGRLEVLLLHRCCELTDAGITYLARFCHKLTKLDLSCCTKITDMSVLAFFNNDGKRKVKLSLCVGRTNVLLKERDFLHPMIHLNFADYTFYWSQFRNDSIPFD